jgi:hypothetical protein
MMRPNIAKKTDAGIFNLFRNIATPAFIFHVMSGKAKSLKCYIKIF